MELSKAVCDEYSNFQTSESISAWSSLYRWMVRDCSIVDPGIYAMLGMAAFMGGSGRITVMLATVMIELTGDTAMIAPMGIACVIAMYVGNRFNHGLYHGLIPVFNIPFLNSAPADCMWLSTVQEIMAHNPKTLPKIVSTDDLRHFLENKDIKHNAFPVTRSEEENHLKESYPALLFKMHCHSQTKCLAKAKEFTHCKYFLIRVTLFYRFHICEQDVGELTLFSLLLLFFLTVVNLLKYADRSPITVYPRNSC